MHLMLLDGVTKNMKQISFWMNEIEIEWISILITFASDFKIPSSALITLNH